MPFARKGEEVRNADGSLYATFARDVEGEDPITVQSLIFAGDAPNVGDPIPDALRDFLLRRRAELKEAQA